MFESRESLYAEIKDLKTNLDIVRTNYDVGEKARECLRAELADAIKAKKDAGESVEALKRTVQMLTTKLDDSGIVEGRILRIEQAPSETPYDTRGGIILTVRINHPTHPRFVWGNNFVESVIGNPNAPEYTRVKAHMEKYRREINEFNAFHVGKVFLRMPALEKE